MGNISAGSIDAPAVLPYTLAAEINFQAFDVSSTDYHNALYGYIEAEGWKNDYDGHQVKVNYTNWIRTEQHQIYKFLKRKKFGISFIIQKIAIIVIANQELKDSIECMRNYIRAHRTIWYKILKFLKQNDCGKIVYYHSLFCLLKLPFAKWKCGCDIYRFAREDNDWKQ